MKTLTQSNQKLFRGGDEFGRNPGNVFKSYAETGYVDNQVALIVHQFAADDNVIAQLDVSPARMASSMTASTRESPTGSMPRFSGLTVLTWA